MTKINQENILSIVCIGKYYRGTKEYCWQSTYFITTKNSGLLKGKTKIYTGYPGYWSYLWTLLEELKIDKDAVNRGLISCQHELIRVATKGELTDEY